MHMQLADAEHELSRLRDPGRYYFTSSNPLPPPPEPTSFEWGSFTNSNGHARHYPAGGIEGSKGRHRRAVSTNHDSSAFDPPSGSRTRTRDQKDSLRRERLPDGPHSTIRPGALPDQRVLPRKSQESLPPSG